MATIKFLRDTLNFGDAVIRKLRTFKDVSIKGELYSRELFSRHFKTDGAVCSLKQDTSFSVTITIYLQKISGYNLYSEKSHRHKKEDVSAF